jgi:hypothetical protein
VVKRQSHSLLASTFCTDDCDYILKNRLSHPQRPKRSGPIENPIVNVMRKAEAENKRLHEEVETLKDQLQDMSVKYYDAVAVINYLEKFFSGKK